MRTQAQIEADRRYKETHRREINMRMRERDAQRSEDMKLNSYEIAERRAQSATGCPICVQGFTDIYHSERVCSVHLNWLVTTCRECGVVSFSDCAGYCMKHGQDNGASRTLGYNKDHRYMLRVYGFEGYER